MTKPTLTLDVKSVYGSIYAYPADDFTRLLLRLKDRRKKESDIELARCFDAHNIHTLQQIAAELGAELVENSLLKRDADRLKWSEEKKLFLPRENNDPSS